MSRQTQIIGLSENAINFLNENAQQEPCNFCPHCNKAIDTRIISFVYASAAEEGMFDDGPKLLQYPLKNGEIAKEIVQAVPWSSGPCIFLCLEIAGAKYFEWPESALQNC